MNEKGGRALARGQEGDKLRQKRAVRGRNTEEEQEHSSCLWQRTSRARSREKRVEDACAGAQPS